VVILRRRERKGKRIRKSRLHTTLIPLVRSASRSFRRAIVGSTSTSATNTCSTERCEKPIGSTVEEASEREAELWNKVYDDEEALARAQHRVEVCLERCLEVSKASFLKEHATTMGIAGAAASVSIGVAATRGVSSDTGGGGPPVTVGAPAAEAVSTTPSYVQCAGRYSSFWNVRSDPSQHREFVGMPNAMFFDVAIASIHISGQPPFVDVDGEITEDGSFEAAGMGTVAGFPDVSVRMTGTITGCTDVAGTLRATYTVGVNGELPGGESISYDVNATK
jgi:hypothetical protein